ncbi:hypothetical protein AGMMS49938_00990 [Fibrobacterales bacterium]|nr:hypothetical protein AGMMS49938_00990 [Fibrobacterales bacterium]
MIPRLFYDPLCPVCRSFAGLLRKNLDGAVELVELDIKEAKTSKDFRLELSDGSVLYGEQAIQRLASEVPKVKDFFWMLPDSYRNKAVLQSYRFAKWLRKMFVRRECRECGD